MIAYIIEIKNKIVLIFNFMKLTISNQVAKVNSMYKFHPVG